MKISTVLLLATLLFFVNTGCKKDMRPGDSMIKNLAPVARAGGDILVWWPVSETELRGSATDYENNISEVSWAKISGPNSYIIENNNSVFTKITGLEKGVYQFELTVKDHKDLYDKDTTLVTVGEMVASPNGIIFKNLVWVFPWYNSLEIKNFYSNISPGTMFRIFVQRDNNPEWKEVLPTPGTGLYDYFIITGPHDFYSEGSLYISYYGFDVSDSPDVKLVY